MRTLWVGDGLNVWNFASLFFFRQQFVKPQMQTYCVIWGFFLEGKTIMSGGWIFVWILRWCVPAKMIICWRTLDAWYPMMESLLKPLVVFVISLCPCCKKPPTKPDTSVLTRKEGSNIVSSLGFYLCMVEPMGREETRIVCCVEQKAVGKVDCSFDWGA